MSFSTEHPEVKGQGQISIGKQINEDKSNNKSLLLPAVIKLTNIKAPETPASVWFSYFDKE